MIYWNYRNDLKLRKVLIIVKDYQQNIIKEAQKICKNISQEQMDFQKSIKERRGITIF